jgi:hypothetical protein
MLGDARSVEDNVREAVCEEVERYMHVDDERTSEGGSR